MSDLFAIFLPQGLLGSLAFVREYLIPTELLNRKAKFLGAYVIDMVLNYDSTPGSQSLPRDIMTVRILVFDPLHESFLTSLNVKLSQVPSTKNELI